MTYAAFGSTKLDPRLTEQAPTEDPTVGGEFSKGVSRGLRQAGSSLGEIGGLGAEAMGLDGTARTLRQGALSLREAGAAPEFAAEAPTWNDVHSVGQGLRWGVGKAGEMAPIMGAAVAGGAATGNPLVGGTLAMAPFSAGDIAQRQNEDPAVANQSAGVRLARAAGYGTAGAALMNVPIAGMAGKLGAKAVPGLELAGSRTLAGALAKNVGEGAVTGGLGMGGAELLNQQGVNPNAEFNLDQAGESALGGAVTMGIGHVPAAGLSYLKGHGQAIGEGLSSARTSINDRLAKMKEAAGDKVDAAAETAPGQKVKGVYDDFGDLIQRGKAKFDDTVDKLMKGEELGIDPKELATATADRVKEMFDFSDNEKVKAATKMGKEMLDDVGLDAAKRQEVADALASVKDRAGQVAMAGLKKTWDMGKAAGAKIDEFTSAVKKGREDAQVAAAAKGMDDFTNNTLRGMGLSEEQIAETRARVEAKKPTINERKAFIDEQVAKGMTPDQARAAFVEAQNGPRREMPAPPEPPKFSKDYAGANKAIADALGPLLKISRPELAENTQAMNKLADGLRTAVSDLPTKQLSSDAIFRLIDALGKDTVPTLTKAWQAVGDPAKAEGFYKNLNEIADIQQRTGKLSDLVGKSLTEASQKLIHPDQYGELTHMLLARARGEGVDPHAGPNQRKAADAQFRSLMAEHFGDKADAVSLAVEKEAGLGKGREEAAQSSRAKGSDEQFNTETGERQSPEKLETMRFGLTEPDAAGNSKSKLGGEPMAKDNRYTKQHIEDLKTKYPQHDVRWEKTENSDLGHIVVEKAADPEALTTADVESMRLDKKYPNSKDKITVGGKALDTKRIAKIMDRRLEYSAADEQSRAHRMARMFNEGIARLMELHGKFDVPDSAVIGEVGGKPFTFGMAKKLDYRTEADKKYDALTQEMVTQRKAYKTAGPNERINLTKMYRETVARRNKLRDEELSKDSGNFRTSDDPGLSMHESGKDAEIHAAVEGKDEPLFAGAGEKEFNGKKTGEVIRPQSGEELKTDWRNTAPNDGELVHGANMDGSKHSHNASDRVSAQDGAARNELLSTTYKWANVKGAGVEALANRTRTLLDNAGVLGKADLRNLLALAGKNPAEAAPVVNALARKYKDVIVPPGAKGESVRPPKGPIGKNPVRFDREGRVEGQPDQKAVAAKKAAFLERAASGDKALIKELSTSDDAKGLQRAVGALAEAHPDSEAMKAATARLSELVKNPDTAYGLQTTKYSLEAVRIHTDLGREGFAATHDSPIKHEGKFDWREHKGKGEGNAAFGAGTYLSTADGVHRAYKNQFTRKASGAHQGAVLGEEWVKGRIAELQKALRQLQDYMGEYKVVAWDRDIGEYKVTDPSSRESYGENITLIDDLVGDVARELQELRKPLTKSPTYEVSVDIKPEQLLDWNAPLSEQSELVQKALAKAGFEYRDYRDDIAALSDRITKLSTRIKELPREESAHYEAMEKWHDDNPIESAMGERSDPRDNRLYWAKERDSAHDQLKAAKAELRDLQTKAAHTSAHGDGEAIYREITARLGSQAAASDYLQSLGILGHRFNAAGGRNDAHPNYVIYDDSKITTNYVRFDKSAADPNATHTQAYRDSVKDHITKVLGNTVKVAWKNLTTMQHAGDYTHALKLIRLSVHALDPMSTGYHESLHAFFAQLRDAGAHDITGVLKKAASSQHVIEQLRERYKNQPDVLKQLADPEERAAYMYQTWASDPTFKVGIAAKGVFGKIKEFIQHLMGAWTNDERALHIMEYFHSGEYAKNMSSPSGVRAALMNSHRSQILETAKSFTEPLAHLADAIVGTGGARLRDTGIPALNQLADIMKREHTEKGGDQGFIQASRVEATKMRIQLGVLLEPYTKEQLHDAMEALHSNTPAVSAEGRLAARAIKGFLKDAHGYMKDAGVDIGNLGPDYFPRVWDTHYISKNQQAFRDMLEPYIRHGDMKGSADDLIHNLTTRGGVELGIESREPGMQFKKERKLDFITPQDAAQFVEKNLLGTLSSYITQAARKAEWTRRLGGGKLETLINEAKQQGATKEHIQLAETYMKGIDGTLGDDLNPTARRIMGDMIVYQNVRLLPTAAFSMLIDPNGVMVRGGTVGDAWATFKRGMAGIKDTFKKDGGEANADQATKWAELVGVVDSAMMSHAMGDVFSQGMVGGTAQKINNAFFKYNLVEGLNRNFRIGATEAAIKFLARHAGGLEGLGSSVHSERWMKELGLQKGDIKTTPEGYLALTELEGLQAPQVRRVHAAINQWVDGAVLRPDASDKPIWMNDPHYALISHLKQFVFSFQKTILERVVHEFKHGNYTPVMALASYVPIMMAADMAKGALVTGGGTPAWQQGWTPADYLEYGVERAGLLGVGQFGMDVAKNIHRGGTGVGALAGPTIEQFGGIVSTLGGHKQFGNTVIDALPANTFVKGWSGHGESKADPVFAE